MSVTFEDLKKICTGLVSDEVLNKLDPSQPMMSQGLDSLAMTAMAVAVQKNFNVTIMPEDALDMKTPNDVVAFLNRASI